MVVDEDWANEIGISDGQLYAYQQFTNYMTIEENPE